jgi:hypothetical protein
MPTASNTSSAVHGSRGILGMGHMPRSTRNFVASLTRMDSRLSLVTRSTSVVLGVEALGLLLRQRRLALIQASLSSVKLDLLLP